MRRILFVDDETRVLQGLSRMMRYMQREWQMDFVDSGEKAVNLFEQSPYDAVVTDMRMPCMSGAELLQIICDRFPGTLRVILSGQSEKQAILRSLECTHRYHAKPCEAASIVQILNEAFDTLFSESPKLRAKLTGIRNLPYRQDIGHQIKSICQAQAHTLAELTHTVSQDVALSIRLLHLANSSFFSAPGTVADLNSAVLLLGADGVSQVNEIVQQRQREEASCSAAMQDFARNVGEHSYLVARAAARIARLERRSEAEVGAAFTAGILHDAGRLAMMAGMPTEYEGVVAECASHPDDIEHLERRIFGFDHGDAGRYMLSLMGISQSAVDAATFHHRPRDLQCKEFSVAAAIHVADSTVRCAGGGHQGSSTGFIDLEYLQHIGCAHRLEQWQHETKRELQA